MSKNQKVEMENMKPKKSNEQKANSWMRKNLALAARILTRTVLRLAIRLAPDDIADFIEGASIEISQAESLWEKLVWTSGILWASMASREVFSSDEEDVEEVSGVDKN